MITKFAVDESKLRHDVRKEIVRNSGDTTWVTDAVIRGYTAGQTADMNGSIDAFHQMSKAKETGSLAGQLHELEQPVRLLVGTKSHPAEVTSDQRELLTEKLPDFKTDTVHGSGQYMSEEQPGKVVDAVTQLDAATQQDQATR
jgi:pimeloyl-ACP methyl ester carboxylesterase